MPFEKKKLRFGREIVDLHAARQVVLDDGEAVAERERQLRDRIGPGFGDVVAGDGHRIEIADAVFHEELLDVAHHAQGEFGAEDAGVLRLVFLQDVGLHGAAHQGQGFSADTGVGFGIQQLIAGQAQQGQAQAVVGRRQFAVVFRLLAFGNKAAIFFCASSQRASSARRYFSTCWSMAVFMNMARIIGAGPLMVMLTLVFGAHRSKPEYSFFMSSRLAMDTPELPILP